MSSASFDRWVVLVSSLHPGFALGKAEDSVLQLRQNILHYENPIFPHSLFSFYSLGIILFIFFLLTNRHKRQPVSCNDEHFGKSNNFHVWSMLSSHVERDQRSACCLSKNFGIWFDGIIAILSNIIFPNYFH